MFPSNTLKRTNFSNIVVENPECDIYIEKELKEAGLETSSGHDNWKLFDRTRYMKYEDKYYEDHDRRLYHIQSEVPYHIVGKYNQFIFERAWYYYVVNGNVPLEVAKELYSNPIGRIDIRVGGDCSCPPPNYTVYTYHIDSQEGLNLFVSTIKKYNLSGHESDFHDKRKIRQNNEVK